MTPEDRTAFIADVAAAIRATDNQSQLSEDEQRWVRLAIQREVQMIDLRRAVITKSLSGLVWAAVVGLGYMLLGWATQHGYKP